MTTVIAMWSGPRNISTTMMRAFGNRTDTAALDEPFYAVYLAASRAEHPYREQTLAAYPRDFERALAWIAEPRAAPILLLKHIAYHLQGDADLSFLTSWRNFLLIRDPRAMVASFAGKFEDATPIVRSYEIERRILDHLTRHGLPCPVIDASDIQRAPEAMLRALCASLDISFDPAMLAWPEGPRAHDGPWAPHWYDAVNASTGFNAHVEKKLKLSSGLEEIAEQARPAYLALYARRLVT